MKKIRFIFSMIAGFVLLGYAQAAHISVVGPPPQLHIAVGTLGATVDTISFNVPSGSEGNSTPIAGSATLLIEVAVRRGGAQGTTVNVSVAHSADMNTSPAGPTPIPMSEISWTSTAQVFGADTNFSGTGQQLLSFTAPTGLTRREDTWTFSYANTTTPVGGTYTATVTFSATAL